MYICTRVYVHYTYIVYCTTLCKKVTEKTVSEKLRKEAKEKVPIFFTRIQKLGFYARVFFSWELNRRWFTLTEVYFTTKHMLTFIFTQNSLSALIHVRVFSYIILSILYIFINKYNAQENTRILFCLFWMHFSPLRDLVSNMQVFKELIDAKSIKLILGY